MWTAANRENYSRKTTRYQSDVTDEEWRIIGPLLPRPRTTGRPRAWPLREIVNGIFYVMRSGCTWRQLPTDLPPWSTVYRWFAAWRDICLFERINHALVIADRERMGGQLYAKHNHNDDLSSDFGRGQWDSRPDRQGRR
jgi:transposase